MSGKSRRPLLALALSATAFFIAAALGAWLLWR